MPPGALWRPGRFRFAGSAPTLGQPLFGEGQVLAGAFASEHLPELVVKESGVLLESLEHASAVGPGEQASNEALVVVGDRKSTRLNSSHLGISYAVFCLKKK